MIKTEVIIDEEKFNLARKWLEYIPDSWDLDELMEKNAASLAGDVLKILVQVRRDEEMLETLDNVLSYVRETGYVYGKMEKDIKEIYDYVDSKAYYFKIGAPEKEYVDMLISEIDFGSDKSLNQVTEVLQNINNEFIRMYAEDKVREAKALHDANETRKNAGKKSRSKRVHSVFPRVPNRIK